MSWLLSPRACSPGRENPQPDLVVYLRASKDTLMERIAHRDRPYERDMDRAYIDELNALTRLFLQPQVGGTLAAH
jgi:deoxyadenosine/deoxycytidine kinase